jgi:hypothetical protein
MLYTKKKSGNNVSLPIYTRTNQMPVIRLSLCLGKQCNRENNTEMCGGRATTAEQFGQSDVQISNSSPFVSVLHLIPIAYNSISFVISLFLKFETFQIDLHSGSTGSARNELKRPRQLNLSSKPPVPAKRLQVAPPSPSNPTCTIVIGAADVTSASAANSKERPGVFDFPMLKTGCVDRGQFYDVFFRLLVDAGPLSKPIVLEGFRSFDEIMDPDMEHI